MRSHWDRPPPRAPRGGVKLRPRGSPAAVSAPHRAAPAPLPRHHPPNPLAAPTSAPPRLTVAGTRVGLGLAGSDFKFALTALPSAGGTACLDFSRGEPPCPFGPGT
jgi:hypothetical protein